MVKRKKEKKDQRELSNDQVQNEEGEGAVHMEAQEPYNHHIPQQHTQPNTPPKQR